jgi:aquaporin rerated protein, other eukaryote
MSSTSHFSSFKVDAEGAVVEFIGTIVFLLLGLGGIQVAKGDPTTDSGGSAIEQVLYISTSMGLSLLVSAWLFFRVTGGPFNPNITLALLLVGEIKPLRFVLFCIAQMLGAIAASGLLLALTPGPLSVKLVHMAYFFSIHISQLFS